MRNRLLLLALLLVVVGASATTAAFQGSSGHPGKRITEVAVADSAVRTVTLRNETRSRIWVGSTVNSDGSTPLKGLPTLDPGQVGTVTIPKGPGPGHWRGTLFARQGCTGEHSTTFHCAVGDCGPFVDRCSSGEQPTSLAEFNFDPADAGAPWYNISYVNAVSVPVTIVPDGVEPPKNGGECAEAGCPGNLRAACPSENLIMDQGTDTPLVCVNPNRDAKTAYSEMLTQQCPKAYAWSRHDTEAGNQVMHHCSKCSGLTVTFHEGGTPGDSNSHTPIRTEVDNPAPVPAARRGVALKSVDGAAEALTESGATWYHNWASSSGVVAKPEGIEYVPMIWGADSVTDTELGKAAQEGRNLLTFHEPDSPTQANMTPEQALDLWPRLEETGLPLGAPAVAAGADTPDGWLDRFMRGATERGLRVDFIPVHWYGSDFGPAATGHLAGYLQRIHDRYQKPVWLTEYALIDYSQGLPRYPNEQEQAAFIASSTTMLDRLAYVQRYAWFALDSKTSPTGLYDGTTPNASGTAYRDGGN